MFLLTLLLMGQWRLLQRMINKKLLFSAALFAGILILLMIFNISLASSVICNKACYEVRYYASTDTDCSPDVGGWREYESSCPSLNCYDANRRSADSNGHWSHGRSSCKWGTYSGCGSYSCSDYWGSAISCTGTQAYRDYYYTNCASGGCGSTRAWLRYSSWDSQCCVPVAEICDNLDNDCDASVDEGNVCAKVNATY